MKATLAILLAGVVLCGAGLAQVTNLTKGLSNSRAPIDLSANFSSFDQNTGMLIYTGNVVVHQGDVKMRADAMKAKLKDSKPTHIYADGRVVIDAPSGIATGDNGVYDITPRIITLTGHVVLTTKDKKVIRGQQLVVNLATGLATLDGGQNKTGRVQALFPAGGDNSENP